MPAIFGFSLQNAEIIDWVAGRQSHEPPSPYSQIMMLYDAHITRTFRADFNRLSSERLPRETFHFRASKRALASAQSLIIF